MNNRISKYRLQTSAFKRPDEQDSMTSKRMVVLSVEGTETERNYFELMNFYLDNSIIRIEVLRRRHGDGYTDPIQVIELLDEYVNLRNGGILPEEISVEFQEKYSKDFISKYLNDDPDLTINEKKSFKEELFILGIDIEYRKYLKTFDNENDIFGVIIDRDKGGHSIELMERCLAICNDKTYKCYVSNPCFEFWLLLHLCDVYTEFTEEEKQELFENRKVSNKHTYISRQISDRAHHTKHISKTKFDEVYKTNIAIALKRAEQFAQDFPELFNSLGTNVNKLIKDIGFK